MNNLIHADIFFFTSTIGFIVIAILLAVLIFFTIKTVLSFLRILEKIEDSLDTIGDTTRELLEDLQDNIFFKMIFRPKKKKSKTLGK